MASGYIYSSSSYVDRRKSHVAAGPFGKARVYLHLCRVDIFNRKITKGMYIWRYICMCAYVYIWCRQRLTELLIKSLFKLKLPPYTPAGFDKLLTKSSASNSSVGFILGSIQWNRLSRNNFWAVTYAQHFVICSDLLWPWNAFKSQIIVHRSNKKVMSAFLCDYVSKNLSEKFFSAEMGFHEMGIGQIKK
jgi:hypothetical protein